MKKNRSPAYILPGESVRNFRSYEELVRMATASPIDRRQPWTGVLKPHGYMLACGKTSNVLLSAGVVIAVRTIDDLYVLDTSTLNMGITPMAVSAADTFARAVDSTGWFDHPVHRVSVDKLSALHNVKPKREDTMKDT